jgi:hypothetical protein
MRAAVGTYRRHAAGLPADGMDPRVPRKGGMGQVLVDQRPPRRPVTRSAGGHHRSVGYCVSFRELPFLRLIVRPRHLHSPVRHAPSACEQAERTCRFAGGVAESAGDAGVAGQAQDADDQVADGGHDVRSGAGAGSGGVLAEGDAADPVELVLDLPVAADPGGEPPEPAVLLAS